jgi:hypothetical protein
MERGEMEWGPVEDELAQSQQQHGLLPQQKSGAMIPAHAEAGRNIRSATGHKPYIGKAPEPDEVTHPTLALFQYKALVI